MRPLIFTFILLIILSHSSFSQSNNPSSSEDVEKQNESFVGEWVLDLRPSPDADPYLQTLTISHDGKNFTGFFYGSAIQEVYVNENWDKLYFAFQSSDTSNEYFQSGYIIGDEIFGVTYCPARNFVMPWTGKRMKKE